MISKSNPITITIIILIGVLFHFFSIISIFDIYFKTPLLMGLPVTTTDIGNPIYPKAKRVVVVVLDGGRGDIFFEVLGRGTAPFLRKKAEVEGVYGISHAHVPTETVPEFIAIGSGFTQDVSEVIHAFSDPPVTLDSTLNQSNYAWAFGKASCLFVKYARKNVYCAAKTNVLNFQRENSHLSDLKLIVATESLFEKSKKDSILANKLKSDKIIFFYQFESFDEVGHGFGPHSQEYKADYDHISEYIERLEKKFYEYYGDNKTAFIITSDHGINNNNVHGDGSDECTQTPFLAWGAGIRKAIKLNKTNRNPSKWKLNNILRTDINQIDISPLISVLINIPFSTNNFGIFNEKILDYDDQIKSKLCYKNSLQLLETYINKEYMKKQSIFFVPFEPLKNYTQRKKNIENLIDNKDYIKAINDIHLFSKDIIKGLNYLQTYDKYYLSTTVVIGYILWMLYLFVYVSISNDKNKKDSIIFTIGGKIPLIISIIISLLSIIYFYLRKSEWNYYLYLIFPLYFFWKIISNIKYLFTYFKSSNNNCWFIKILCHIIILLILTLMVYIII